MILYLQKILRDRVGKNTVVSSFAFRLPLCKLAVAASAATRHEIISILDITTLSQTKSCYSGLFPALSPILETDLTILNKIYVNYSSNIDDKFVLRSHDYGVTVSKIGFNFRRDAVAYVNREFSAKTYMRIQDILDTDDIDEDSSILVVNGFHYKGIWESPFDQFSTTFKQFRSGDKNLKIAMMYKVEQTLYLNDASGQFKAISLHLSQVGVTMTFVLPYRNSSIIRILDTMSQYPTFIEDINEKMEWKFVKIVMPKFKLKTCLDWTPYLKQIGLNLTTHKNNTGLNRILKSTNSGPNMYVSKAKQKIFVEINEGPKTSEHAGVAENPLVKPELRQPAIPAVELNDFTVDGPFFFTVSMTPRQTEPKQTNKIFRLLNGIYYGPD
ncbi:serine protease inhibitor 3/4-like [Leguminivora glycinivorella]|uniref:serine protease inhibitor 3/4-like n=1 Tax=Leguminivora glycinivorella TaxID=1035111 RepID=UPI00200CF9A8|nr:serine protease inhibitor 3/4-like [Leguminivora glycinivorella]